MTDLLLRRVEVAGDVVDVHVHEGRVAAIGCDLRADGGDEIDGEGGALLPGLHDHHVHVFAAAATEGSVDAGGDVLAALRAAAAGIANGGWLRAVGWHEAHGADLDRHVLDAAVPHRPVRVQHATGALWVLNTLGLEEAGLAGHPTGRLYGMDAWLRDRLHGEVPDVTWLGRQLAAFGVTSVTDATPYTRVDDVDRLVGAGLPQRVVVTGAPALDLGHLDRRTVGPAKIVVEDHDPPSVEDLAAQVTAARAHGRAVAFHCASRLALVLTLAALADAGSRSGDRIEHGAVIPDDAVGELLRLGLTVVTQPGFVPERGDRWRAEVDDDDRPYLWRCGSLLRAGVPVLGSTDAPYGPLDPWRAIAAAVDRRTATGAVVGEHERVDARTALDLFLGGRRVHVGAPADLCLLRCSLDEALDARDSSAVRMTLTAT